MYELGSKVGFFIIPEGDPTFFVFSQGTIIDVLLPNFISLRNSILLNNPSYNSKIAGDHSLFGANNDDPKWSDLGITPSSDNYPFTNSDFDFDGASYTFTPANDEEIDSIRWFNQQIRMWEETIASNEEEKVTAILTGVPGKVRQLSQKAIHLHDAMPGLPHVAAVCVYPTMVGVAKEALGNRDINVASVATAFPSGQAPLSVKLDDTRMAVDAGANEIDMVISRGAFLAGNYGLVFDEIVAIKEACGEAHLKVILETGELGALDRVRQASELAKHPLCRR